MTLNALGEVLATAVAFATADESNIQVFDSASGALQIAAIMASKSHFCGLRLSATNMPHAGTATQAGERVIVDDVARSEISAGQPSVKVLLDAGVCAVQSTPLVSSAGNILVMISAHFSSPHRPSERELRFIDLWRSSVPEGKLTVRLLQFRY